MNNPEYLELFARFLARKGLYNSPYAERELQGAQTLPGWHDGLYRLFLGNKHLLEAA